MLDPQRQRRPSGFAAFLPPLPPVESNPPRYEPRETSQVASRQEVFRAMMSEKKSVVPKRSFFGCSDGARRPETRNAEQLETRDRRRAQPVRGLKNTATGSRDPRDPLGGPWADRSFNYFSGRLLSTASVPGPIRGCTIRAALDVVGQV